MWSAAAQLCGWMYDRRVRAGKSLFSDHLSNGQEHYERFAAVLGAQRTGAWAFAGAAGNLEGLDHSH